MKKLVSTVAALGLPLALLSTNAQAYLVDTQSCTAGSLTMTHIEESPLDGNNSVYNGSIDATQCAGVFLEGAPDANDDANGRSSPSPNIGHLGDGFLNGETLKNGDPDSAIDPYTFIDSPGADDSPSLSQPHDVPGNGSLDDPGWIHLANIGFPGTDGNDSNIAYSSIGSGASTLDLDDVLDITWECASAGPDGCKTGTWSLETSTDIVAKVQDLLGPNTFDHLAISVFQANKLVVYDFDFTILTQPGGLLDGLISFVTPYSFSGTWDMKDFSPQNSSFSHINFWARDPADQSTRIPQPTALVLLAAGLIGISVAKRQRARRA